MIEKLQTSEEQANLHIVKNMDVNNLPQFMQNVLSLANTPAEKDMLLMSALRACGSVMPNLYCRYGIAAKRYSPTPNPTNNSPLSSELSSLVSSRKEQQKGWPIDHPFVEKT